MIEVDAQRNLWTHSAPPPPATVPLAGILATDVAIVGGGFTGLSAALHLAENGVDCTVLEARTIGHGGSGRNVGLVNAGMWVRPEEVISTLGADVGNRILDDLGAGPGLVYSLIEKHGIECEAVRNGTLHMAVGEAGVKEIRIRAEQWQKRGAPVEVVSAADAERLTGAKGFAGALLDRRAGTVQPLAYAYGLARAALAAGARIHTSSPVLQGKKTATGFELETPEGKVTARKVIIASNAYASMVPGMNWSGHRDEITEMRYFQFATSPLPANIAARILPEEHGCWDTGLVMTSFRKDKAGRLIFGSIGALDSLSSATHRDFSRRSLRALFPFLDKVEFEYWWDGTIGMTRNNLPAFHEPEDGVWSITGYNGRGISPGTVFGRAMADVAMGRREAMPLKTEPVSPDPLRKPRALFLRAGAAAKHLIDRRF